MAWRISYWDKKGDLAVIGGLVSEDAAKKRAAEDAVAGLIDYDGNFGALVDEYEPEFEFSGLEIDA